MQPILVRLEMGPAAGPLPPIAAVTSEFLRKAQDAGVPLKPALRGRETLEHPEAWGAEPGAEGIVSYFGAMTDRDDAVRVLSEITVTAPAVIDVTIPSPEQIDTFQREAQEIVAQRKQQAQAAQLNGNGRHAKQFDTRRGMTADHQSSEDEVVELRLDTPDTARKTPVDVVALLS